MMKFMVALAMVISSSFALAEGGGENFGAEEVIAAGGLTTVVGGGCVATVVQNGENSEITYSGECLTAPTKPLTCEATQASYGLVNGKWAFLGYVCPDYNNQNGGN